VLERELDMDDILPADVQMIATAIKRTAALYADTPTVRTLQVAAMKAAKDFSWVQATKEYVKHFLVSVVPCHLTVVVLSSDAYVYT
jgi:glycogen synthase